MFDQPIWAPFNPFKLPVTGHEPGAALNQKLEQSWLFSSPPPTFRLGWVNGRKVSTTVSVLNKSVKYVRVSLMGNACLKKKNATTLAHAAVAALLLGEHAKYILLHINQMLFCVL